MERELKKYNIDHFDLFPRNVVMDEYNNVTVIDWKTAMLKK